MVSGELQRADDNDGDDHTILIDLSIVPRVHCYLSIIKTSHKKLSYPVSINQGFRFFIAKLGTVMASSVSGSN